MSPPAIQPGTLDRRGVLRIGVAAGACALPGTTWAAATGCDGIVIDTRYADSRNQPTPIGAWRHEMDGDVTALWYDRLDAAWRHRGGMIGGLTGDDALFVLERLAWDRGRRVTLRQPVQGTLVRWTIGPKPVSGRA